MYLGLLVSLMMVLSACGSRSLIPPPPADEQLIPDITADGTKFFVFQRDYRRPQDVEDEFEFRPSGNHQNNRSRGAVITGEANVEGRLSLIMERTGYCRTGFFELYREQTLQRFSVRGECREGATDDDRRRFSGGPIMLD
jgi:hypothetical protein